MNPNLSAGEAAKRCTLLRRRHDSTFQSFAEHWAGPHASIAVTMPGIARYTQNRLSEQLWALGEPRGFDCDGIVELEFRDEQALTEAGNSEAARTLLPEDEERFLDGITLCRVPRGARQTWPEMAKVMLAGCLRQEGYLDALHDLLKDSGCVEFAIAPVSATSHRPRLAFEADPPHVFASLWFEHGCDLAAVFSDDSHWGGQAKSVFRRGAAWRSDPLKIVG